MNDSPAAPSSPPPASPAALSPGPGKGLVLLIILVLVTVLPVAMFAPFLVTSLLLKSEPKTAAQLIADKLGADGGAFDAKAFGRGKAAFAASCSACHTPDGGAKPGLGKDMIHSEFTAGISDDELVAFITTGRDAGDPLNTTGVGMPAKGGNPALSEKDLRDLVAFIRGRQVEEGVELSVH